MKNHKRTESWERGIDRRERLGIPTSRLDYRPAQERIRDFDEACLGFSTETAMAEASRCIHCPSPEGCVLACPLHNQIPAAMWEISEGHLTEAAAIYRQTSNFPELCGRLCPDESLCAGSCPVGKHYANIRLGRLEAFVADCQRETQGLPIPPVPSPTGRRVAVVGSGPAGLTVAEELARRGHAVTVLEMRPKPGGMLVYTIPRFRLPVHIVEAKVAQLERLGVQFVVGVRVGRDVTVEDLFRQGYHAVFLGTGAGFEATAHLPGTDLQGVHLATEFMLHTNLNKAYLLPDDQSPTPTGKHVAILGGGHAAVDCARTAVRLGAQEVTCYHPGREMDELCRLEDKSAAQDEHVRFVALTEPVNLIGDESGHVVSVQCRRMRANGPTGEGQPMPDDDSLFAVDADMVVLASERDPDPQIAEATPGLEMEPGGWIIVDPKTGETTHRGVFAAGDNTGQSQLAVVAIARGRKVAANIHEYLR